MVKIAVVEDDETLSALLKYNLSRKSFTVVTAAGQAVELTPREFELC